MYYNYGYPYYYQRSGYYPSMNGQDYYNYYYNMNPNHYHSEEYPNDNYSNAYNNYGYYQDNSNVEEKQNDNQNYYWPRHRHHHHHHYNGRDNQRENNQREKKEEKKENKVKSNDELILDYENNLRKELEQTPLISENISVNKLVDEYKSNEEYSKSVENISKKYKEIRKVRRDGNCFYRAFIFRLFEHICMKNNKELFEKIKQKIIGAKELTGRNGYDWIVVEDFYDLFLEEFNSCFNSLEKNITVRDYLDNLFKDKNKGNYLIYFIRFCIAAFLKEKKEDYKMYIEGPFENWVRNEVEAIDHEADEIQIMACVNYFDIGVKIEYLNKNQREVVKLPYDKSDDQFFIFLLFTPGHYDILYP